MVVRLHDLTGLDGVLRMFTRMKLEVTELDKLQAGIGSTCSTVQ